MDQQVLHEQVARALHLHSVHDPYCLLFGPDNLDLPGLYLLRVMLAVPEDRATDCYWTATSLDRAREMIPAGLIRWPKVRTTPRLLHTRHAAAGHGRVVLAGGGLHTTSMGDTDAAGRNAVVNSHKAARNSRGRAQ
jgi:hypothetical protein